jgi:hypothetical protein
MLDYGEQVNITSSEKLKELVIDSLLAVTEKEQRSV